MPVEFQIPWPEAEPRSRLPPWTILHDMALQRLPNSPLCNYEQGRAPARHTQDLWLRENFASVMLAILDNWTDCWFKPLHVTISLPWIKRRRNSRRGNKFFPRYETLPVRIIEHRVRMCLLLAWELTWPGLEVRPVPRRRSHEWRLTPCTGELVLRPAPVSSIELIELTDDIDHSGDPNYIPFWKKEHLI